MSVKVTRLTNNRVNVSVRGKSLDKIPTARLDALARKAVPGVKLLTKHGNDRHAVRIYG